MNELFSFAGEFGSDSTASSSAAAASTTATAAATTATATTSASSSFSRFDHYQVFQSSRQIESFT